MFKIMRKSLLTVIGIFVVAAFPVVIFFYFFYRVVVYTLNTSLISLVLVNALLSYLFSYVWEGEKVITEEQLIELVEQIEEISPSSSFVIGRMLSKVKTKKTH